MEVDSNAPALESLFDNRRSPSPEVEIISHSLPPQDFPLQDFPRKIYQDHNRIPPPSTQKAGQETQPKARGRPRKIPAIASSSATVAEPSSGRVTRSQAEKVIVKYVPKPPSVRVDNPAESEESDTGTESESAPPAPSIPAIPTPVKRGRGRPKGSKNTKTSSQLDNDPSHVRISIRLPATEKPATSALSNLASRLEEASEVLSFFVLKLINY